MTFDMNQLFLKIFSKNPVFGQNFAPGKFLFEFLVSFHTISMGLSVVYFLGFDTGAGDKEFFAANLTHIEDKKPKPF